MLFAIAKTQGSAVVEVGVAPSAAAQASSYAACTEPGARYEQQDYLDFSVWSLSASALWPEQPSNRILPPKPPFRVWLLHPSHIAGHAATLLTLALLFFELAPLLCSHSE
jgi:hypothetical protein